MQRWMAVVVGAVLVGLGGCGSSGDQSAKPGSLERPDLERIVSEVDPRWILHGGCARANELGDLARRLREHRPKRPTQPEDRFGIASTTKTFVATVVLQLAGEGRLSLEDGVQHWLPGLIPTGRRITVRHLLNHTSGLADDISNLPPLKRVAAAAAQPPLFRPGTEFSYANTNYIALGLIVEKVTGRRLDQVIRDRIFRPLGLEDTSYGAVALRPDDRMPAWLGIPVASRGPVTGDGGIVSNTDDLGRFFGALLAGELLRDRLLSEMRRARFEIGVGLGLFRFDLRCGSAWGHGGEYPAYSTVALASRDGSKIVVVAKPVFDFESVLAMAEELYCS
jgi:D-alanyl-D-alanine carboxypeptidase